MKYPSSVAVDTSGNVYVADKDNHLIRKIVISDTGEATVSTLAGTVINGVGTSGSDNTDAVTGTVARFNYPSDVAVNSFGNVYVADRSNDLIRKIVVANDGTATVSTLAGGAGGYNDGTGTAARFDGPHGVAVDSDGILYVADYNNNRIRKIVEANDGTATVTTLAGSATAGYNDDTGTEAQFSFPVGVAVDSSGSIVYVGDTLNNRIRKIEYK